MQVEVEEVKKVRLCPDCGSPAVDFSPIEGGKSACRVCEWKGEQGELLVMPFDHIYGTDEGVGMALHNEMRTLFSNPIFAIDVIRFLVRWGFVDKDKEGMADRKSATRYIAALARGAFTAVLREREKIEVEKGNGAS